MEQTILEYLINVAPGLVVAVVMLYVLQRRLCAIEDKMMQMLDQCWEHHLNHIDPK